MSGTNLTITGGQRSSLYINGMLYAQAGGGQGTLTNNIAPSGVTSVVLYSGDNTSSGTSSSVHYHTGNSTSGGGCYTVARYRHEHNSGCYGHVCDGNCEFVAGHYEWVYDDNDDGEDDHGWHRKWFPDHTEHSGNQGLVCGGSPPNTFDHWDVGCGMSNGQILGVSAQQVGASYNPNGFTATQSNSGNGRFYIQLIEQNTLSASTCQLPTQTQVQRIAYQNRFYNLVVVEASDGKHYAKYVKHGNLN